MADKWEVRELSEGFTVAEVGEPLNIYARAFFTTSRESADKRAADLNEFGWEVVATRLLSRQENGESFTPDKLVR